jgi:hypothetical protein
MNIPFFATRCIAKNGSQVGERYGTAEAVPFRNCVGKDIISHTNYVALRLGAAAGGAAFHAAVAGAVSGHDAAAGAAAGAVAHFVHGLHR